MIASIVGGLGSLPAAILGSMILGILETMVSGYISSTYRDLFSFSVPDHHPAVLPQWVDGQESGEKL